jgi:hypothetical protein
MEHRTLPLSRRRWVRLVLGLAIAGNLVGAGGAMILLGDATDLTVDEAIRRFRESSAHASPTPSTLAAGTPTPTPSAKATVAGAKKKATVPGSSPAASRPAASGELETGVYVYATEGFEETDALSGQRHTYPSRTTITASRHDCGYRFRWQPLEERWDQSDTCRTSKGIELQRFTIYHEFFQRSATEEFVIEDDGIVLSAYPVAGDSWRWKGASNDSAIDTQVTVVGFETIDVGGRAVKTVHLRYETAMSGDNNGTQVQDRWHSLDNGLLIRSINRVDAKVEVPFGGTANYTERYRIDLKSLSPEG